MLNQLTLAVTAASPAGDVNLAYTMKDYYVSFAKYHDPNKESFSEPMLRESKVAWPPYGSTRDVLNVEAAMVRVTPDPDINARCEFWHSQSGFTRN